MRRFPHPTARALVLCFAGVAVTFTAGITVTQWFNVQIRSAATEITGNSSPSISVLSAMRGTLRELEVTVDDHVDACLAGRCTAKGPRIAELRRALIADWTTYQRLPTFEGESDRWPLVALSLRDLEAALSLTLAAVDARRNSEAEEQLRRGVKPACDRIDAAVADVMRFDHDQGLAIATTIEALARRALAVSVLLALACIALTALAATTAVRFVRRHEHALDERAHDLDQFAGRVAHDIMSPLAATSGALQLVLRRASDDDKPALVRGQRGLQRVQRLVEDLLTFARAGAEPSGTASSDVAEVLDDVLSELQPVAEEHGVELRVEKPARGSVACSPGILTSILSNLVRNAVTYTRTSKIRRVSVRTVPAADDHAVRFEVEDTGPGIPSAMGQSVFEPFVRGPGLGQAGTGLGLATAKRFVSTHGGRIGFDSRPGAGTVFWFEMPLALGGRRG